MEHPARQHKEQRRKARSGELKEEQFRTLFESAPLGCHLMNGKGFVGEVNKAWLKMLGYKRKEVIGRPFSDFLSPRDAKAFEKGYPIIKHSDEVATGQYQLVRNDGSLIDVSATFWSVHDEHGRFVLVHGMLNDITKKKRGAGEREVIRLSEREKEVLGLIRLGKSSRDISSTLGISTSTVKYHVGTIMRKLNATSRTHALAVAMELGIVGKDEGAVSV